MHRLPGSLALVHRRCGKANCHCAQGEGHPLWLLTFMVRGQKHVQSIPPQWVEEIRPLVEQGCEFKEAVSEVFAANAQLLELWQQQNTRNSSKKR